MELEPKIAEVELIRDHDKNPLEPTAMKEGQSRKVSRDRI